jgi:bacteriorhodopsin
MFSLASASSSSCSSVEVVVRQHSSSDHSAVHSIALLLNLCMQGIWCVYALLYTIACEELIVGSALRNTEIHSVLDFVLCVHLAVLLSYCYCYCCTLLLAVCSEDLSKHVLETTSKP